MLSSVGGTSCAADPEIDVHMSSTADLIRDCHLCIWLVLSLLKFGQTRLIVLVQVLEETFLIGRRDLNHVRRCDVGHQRQP